MTTPPRLQFTSIRAREVDGQVLIGLKHNSKGAAGLPVATTWIEMTPEDAAELVRKLQDVLAGRPVK